MARDDLMMPKIAGVYLRRNAVTLVTLLGFATFTAYHIFLSSNYKNTNDHLKSSNHISLNEIIEEDNDLLPTVNTIQEASWKPKEASKTPEELPKKMREKKIPDDKLKARENRGGSGPKPEAPPEVPVKNKWSNKWPRINLSNCSHIEYMNRGINSPSRIDTSPYPRTGIVSFPGSGNTWARHLIQQATGLWTGSVYTDRSLFRGGFLAELDDCEDGGTVAIKAHYPGLDTQQYCKFERAVIVIRDPFRAVLAEFNWRATSQHTGVADPRLYKTKLWMEHVVGRSEKWLTTTRTWLERFHQKCQDSKRLRNDENPFVQSPEFSHALLLVSYERMKKDATKEMERVVKFLGLPEFRKKCVQADVDGNFHRNSQPSESIECLFEKFSLSRTVRNKIDNLKDRIRELGLGDITSEFEGPGGDVLSEKCNYV